MNVEHALGRRREAEQLLDSPLFQEAITTIRSQLIATVFESKPEETGKRDTAYHTYTSLMAIPEFLKQVIVEHQMAENAEARKPKNK